MSKSATNLLIPSDYAVYTGPFGASTPTDPTTAVSTSFYEVGYISAFAEGHTMNANAIYDLVGRKLAEARNQEERTFTFSALEDNRVVRELRYPGSSLSSTAGTAEVQTITVTATSGTATLTGGYGGTSTTAAITLPGTNSAFQTAIRTLPGLGAVAVAGSAGGPYTVTYPAALGNVAQLTADNTNAVGGTATVTTGTPGVAPINTRSVGSGTAQNRRAFLLYLPKGGVHNLFVVPNGEATASGSLDYSGTAGAVVEFTVQCYPDAAGYFLYRIDDDPAQTTAQAYA